MVIGSVYVGYSSVIDIASSSQFTSAALSVMESRVEMVRNMRYQDVGTVGGVPSGTLPQTEDIHIGDVFYALTITIRNVDDPFDGTVFGNPFDPSPADYKLVQFDMTCTAGCATPRTVSMTTYVAEKQLENEDRNGSLLVTVIDAFGEPVPQATVHVVNPAAHPPIDLTTTTNNQGQLLLVSIATGSAAYEVTASKTGFSTDRTYPPNNPANALKPNVTVATQQLSQVTLSIDHLSTLTVQTRDNFCTATGPFAFQLTGGKLIGELPDVAKYDSPHVVDAGGSLTLDQLEWDTYRIVPTDAALDIVGASSPSTVTLQPGATESLTWTVASRSHPSLVVAVTNATGVPVNDATVTVTGSGYDHTRYTGRWWVSDTDWSNGQHSDMSANMDATTAGILTLGLQGGIYATGSAETLTSLTFDLGTTGTVLHRLEWSPDTQPSDTTLRFQLAANDDDATWNYIGPDGASTSYFESPGDIDVTPLNGHRYVRYRVFLETADPQATPTLTDVTLFFSSPCVAGGNAYFGGLSAGTAYALTVNAPGFQTATASYTASEQWSQMILPLSP
jgi:hypothetical protein